MNLLNYTNTDRTFAVPFNDTVTVYIRYISREELTAMYKKATVTRFVNHQKVDEFDPIKGDCLLGRAAVKGWTGVKNGEEDAPCTPENIDLLMTRNAGFAKFVNDICVDIDNLVREEQESARKN